MGNLFKSHLGPDKKTLQIDGINQIYVNVIGNPALSLSASALQAYIWSTLF